MNNITSNNLKIDISEKYISQVSDNLLFFLREEIDDTKVDYEIPPSQLQGGYDTSVFQFKLKNVHLSLSGPLVLRVFRKSHHPKQAIMESVIHNSLVDQRFPVPYIYYACIDDKYLGNQFLIMDFLPGALLPSVFGHDTSIVLGKTHATLHNADSSQLNEDMIVEGFGDRQYSIEGHLDSLLKRSERLPWFKEIVLWLIENRPSECEHPSICHFDFHPYNVLAKDGEVTAILDWSSCKIGDPVMDVAFTLVISNAATKHIIPSFDSKRENQKYLDAYRGERDLNEQHLGYYQVLVSAVKLFAGTKGVLVWTQPPIQHELINIIYDFSKINVEIPR
jgi:aminoglycoside phosphotransferase (APT) family kinase protein